MLMEFLNFILWAVYPSMLRTNKPEQCIFIKYGSANREKTNQFQQVSDLIELEAISTT